MKFPQKAESVMAVFNSDLSPNRVDEMIQGMLFAKMGRKADAEKDLATLKRLNTKLADELEEFLKTGKEEDEYDPTSPKQKSRVLCRVRRTAV